MEASLTDCSGNTNEDVIFFLAVCVNGACVSLVDSLKKCSLGLLIIRRVLNPTILANQKAIFMGTEMTNCVTYMYTQFITQSLNE